jgi:hypothetical protein
MGSNPYTPNTPNTPRYIREGGTYKPTSPSYDPDSKIPEEKEGKFEEIFFNVLGEDEDA